MRTFFVLILVFVLGFSAYAQKSKQLAEDFSGVDVNGQPVAMSELKGKIIVITFWTTHCPICHEEIPKLNKLAAQYKNQDVAFIGLTTENQHNVENYLKFQNFDFTIVPDSFGALLKYADKTGNGSIRMGYPAHFLINQKGEIEFKTEGFAKTEQLSAGIARLLNQKTTKAE